MKVLLKLTRKPYTLYNPLQFNVVEPWLNTSSHQMLHRFGASNIYILITLIKDVHMILTETHLPTSIPGSWKKGDASWGHPVYQNVSARSYP